MWKLPTPATDNVRDDLERAFTRDRGEPPYDISDAEKDQIEDVYQSYDDELGRPVECLTAPGLTRELKDALYDAYAHVQEGGRLQDLREGLKLPADCCPLCGFGSVTDLDHYLPRSEYKALSIYPRNLIPCCGPCNNKKRTVAGENAEDQFVHAYFDAIPEERFLFANASIVNGGLVIEFYVEQIEAMADETFQRISFQMDRLNLAERYKPEVNRFITSQAANFEVVYGDDENAERLRSLLIKNAENHERDENFGMNDWRAALLYSLADCEEFVNGGFVDVCALSIQEGQQVEYA